MAAEPSLQGRLGHLEDALLDMVQRGEALVLRVAAVLADGAPKFVVTWTGISVNLIKFDTYSILVSFRRQSIVIGRRNQITKIDQIPEHDRIIWFTISMVSGRSSLKDRLEK